MVFVDQSEAVDRCRAFLPATEIDRLGKLAEPHRYRRTCAHAALRILAATALGGRTPSGILTRDTDGRLAFPPRAEPTEARFELSLSHAGGYAAIAFSRCGPVGVDIEVPSALSAAEERRFARYSLAESEYVQWHKTTAKERSRLLTRAWTRKEAVLKALGTGLPGDVRTVVTSLTAATATVAATATDPVVQIHSLPIIAGDPAQWTVRDLPDDPTHIGSVAVRAAYAEIHHHRCSILELLGFTERGISDST